MMATRANIRRHRGDTSAIVITVEDADGAAVDVTGATFTLSVANGTSAPSTADYLFQVSGVIVDATAGEVSFTPSAANVATAGEHWYDIQMTDSGGLVTTLADGTFILEQDVTK